MVEFWASIRSDSKMTSLRRQPPWIWFVGLGIIALFLVLGALAATSLRQVAQSVTRSAAPCAPAPCAAPNGFEVKVTNVSMVNGVVTMDLRFKNGTRADPFEAVSHRHTSPADFRVLLANGEELSPRFDQDCRDWGELQIKRGATAGPERLCFTAPAVTMRGSQMIWSPDLGLLFDSVQFDLYPQFPSNH